MGPPRRYDLIGAMQFNVLTHLGLREKHFLLDIGCGSLRGGRLFIPYLLRGHYFGIEPERWKVGKASQTSGQDAIRIKRPDFMRGLAEEAGLMMEELDWHHPSGQQWVVYRAISG